VDSQAVKGRTYTTAPPALAPAAPAAPGAAVDNVHHF